MPAPTKAHGLSGTDLDQIRETLAAGRKPKVVFTDSAGQIAGQIGQVIELTDPKASDEWIVVRFGRDELPFTPADLAIPSRSAPTKARAVPAKSTPGRRADSKTVADSKPEPRTGPTPEPKREPKPEPEFVLDQRPTVPSPREETPMTTPTATNGAAPANGARPAKAAKTKAPASLVVTLSYAEKEWTVAAVQGSKALAKPYSISPADALRMVSLIDVPGVHEAVENIIAAERDEAESRALRLRAELAEIESRIAELSSRG